jgi:hypothetical protein
MASAEVEMVCLSLRSPAGIGLSVETEISKLSEIEMGFGM